MNTNIPLNKPPHHSHQRIYHFDIVECFEGTFHLPSMHNHLKFYLAYNNFTAFKASTSPLSILFKSNIDVKGIFPTTVYYFVKWYSEEVKHILSLLRSNFFLCFNSIICFSFLLILSFLFLQQCFKYNLGYFVICLFDSALHHDLA